MRPTTSRPFRRNAHRTGRGPIRPVPSLVAASVALALAQLAGPASAADCTWNPVTGTWGTAGNWLNCIAGNGNPAGTPGSADSAVIGAAGVVAVTSNQAVNALNNAGTINITGATSLLLNAGGGGTVNSGTINVADSGVLYFDGRSGAHAIGGGGSIVLGGPGARIFMEGAGTTTLATGTTIRGAGQMGQAILQAGAMNFINNGTVSADVSGQSLFLVAPASGGSYTNNSLFEARNGGTLRISGTGVAQGGSGVLRAENGSTVLIENSSITGGTLASVGTGVIGASNSNANLLRNTTITGVVDLLPAGQLRLANDTLLSGRIDVGSSSNLYIDNRTSQGLAGTQSITGTGSIVLAGGGLRVEGAGQTTIGSGVTIAGRGAFGQALLESANHTLINNGLITANVAGQTLFVQRMANGSQAIQNNGVMEAANGGLLALQTDVTGGATSQLRALAGSTIRFDGVTVSGTINTTGGGTVTALNTNANLLSGVTLNGTLSLDAGAAQMRIGNSLVLNGTIGVGGSSNLYFDNRTGLAANQSITGSGSIDLSGGGLRMEGAGATSTTIGPNIVVRGFGAVGQAILQTTAMTLVNNGTFSADVNGQTLALQTPGNSGVWSNQALLEARNGGTLRLDGNVNQLPSGRIVAEAGSTVLLNGVSIDGGVIGTAGGGTFRAINSNANLMSNTTINGVVDLTGSAAQLRLANNAVINGRIDVGSLGNLYLDTRSGLAANQTLSGNGTIAMSGGAVRMEGTGATSITVGPDLVVRGFGAIGSAILQTATTTFTNNGRISADVSGNTLAIQTPANGGTWVNQALMEARNGGTLRLDGSVSQGASGVLRAENGSTVFINGVTVAGGVLDSVGTGTITASNSVANLLSDVRLEGVLQLGGSAAQARIANNAVVNGRIDVANLGVLTLDSRAPSSANQTLSGSGLINMGGGAVRIEGGGQTTIASGLTLAGFGTVGQAVGQTGAHTLVNNGTISASTAGQTLTLQPMANTGGITGTGTLQVAGGTLSVATGQATQQGRLVIGNAGTLATNNQNITLSADYTSDQWGSGNGFNRRAGVTGSGQILAGGNAAQAISGANVVGGSNNYTLTINNVRVGTTTFDYQIANAGTVGPTLRGAIQTGVNGANLTDARLSGTGVTEGNYSAGGPGGSSGTLAVTFTAASAGSLAPLTGQVLNLRSNFENIADQKLNIALASGAAAFHAAQGSVSPSPVTIANQRVGGTAGQFLTVANNAPSGAFTEVLNAGFGTPSAGILATGAITGGLGSGVAGGASDSTSMRVAVDTSTAGARSGTVTVQFQSNGAGTSGLAPIGVGSQDISVSGNVYQIAQPSPGALPGTINLGNFRAGSGPQTTNIALANVNAAPVGFQEGLAAVIAGTSGGAVGTGFANAAAGTSGNLQVGLGAIAAGANNGQVQVQLQSNGITTAGANGLGSLNLGAAQTVTVTGTGWRLAEAGTLPLTIDFGNVLQGSLQSQALSIRNVALADGFSERLDARFASGGTTGAATNNGGTVALLAAGATDNTSMRIGIGTGTLGAVSGQVAVAFDSNGLATSGLGITALPGQTVGVLANVTGNVGTLAQPSAVSPNPVDFGNVRQGAAAPAARALTIANLASIGEGLNASMSAASAGFQASGAFTSLAPGQSNATDLQVRFLDTAGAAGVRNGTATISLVSDGSFNAGQTTDLPSQTVNMTATVYRTANNGANPVGASAAAPVLAARVGGAASTVINVTNTSPDAFTERLNVVGAVGAPGQFLATLTGAATGIAAGATAGAVAVSLDTATAGTFNGTVQMNYVSSGAGTTGAADLAVGVGSAAITGRVYTAAVAQLANSTIDFGIVHVGDSVADRFVALTNGAAVTALNDVLVGSMAVAGPGFSGGGNLGAGLAAQQASTGELRVGLSTAAAGVFNGQASLSLASRNPDMADASVAAGPLQLVAQVNEYANAALAFDGGSASFSGTGNSFVLDFGDVTLGSGPLAASLRVLNDVGAPADLLDGLFDLSGVDFFGAAGFAAFTGLAAGGSLGGYQITFADTGTLGLFTDLIQLSGFGNNASGYYASTAELVTLTIRGNVIAGGGTVPVPATLALLLLGLAALALVGRTAGRTAGRPAGVALH